MGRARRVLVVGFFALAATGCGSSSDADTVLVMAASSLTDAFADIEEAFEALNPEFDVQLNLAGSGALREQILEGAPADAFASANEVIMQQVVDAGQASPPIDFASNELLIAVPLDNPGGIATVDDLADADRLIGLCAQGVPCGDFARQALDQAGVKPSIDTNEGDVRSLLTKIEAGELDGGIVYATDVASSADVEGVALPALVDVDISYPIAELTESPNRAGAAAFIDFVLSPSGQQILASHGFGPAS